MGEIQRYESKLCWDEFYGKVARLVKNPKGEAVLYREYVAREQELQEQVQRLQAQLDKIEAQRKKWRESKKRFRKIARNPLRYSKDQVSIYGEGHVQELSS